ncbi:MAG TPA: ABC transporter permease, partial [Bryobacteraceae bacterium]|nr:ABC transporter permease [Bryobacteraceae bacterium]
QELRDSKLLAGLRATIRREESPLPAGGEGNDKFLARIWVDLRYGVRLLLRNPGFAIVVVLSLALGIGANTAIFQLLNAVRLRALPVAKPEQLAAVRIVDSPRCCRGDFYSDHPDLTGSLWNQIRQQQKGFSELAAWYPRRQNLGRGGEARHADTLMVSGNFFDVLGVQPWLGRLISRPDDYRGCGAQGAVVSYGFWQREFGSDPGVLERKVVLDGHPFQVMGVTPPNFYGVEVGRNFDIAIPLCAEGIFSRKGSLMDSAFSWWITTIGRLKPNWTLERSSAQLAAISPGIFSATVPAQFDSEARKDYLSFRLGAVPAGTGFSTLRTDYQEPLWLLLALSGLVLLIACANLANLMLARASARQREMALRLTLGASRSRLIRQLLTESLLLATLGAAVGAGLAQFLSRAMVTFLSTQQDRIFLELTLDWRVLGFVAGLAGLASVLFGLTPAIQASHTEPGATLKASGRGLSAAGESLFLRRALVISQVALSLVLLTGALLFVRTFQNLTEVNAGFDENHVLVADFDYSPLKLPKENQMAFKRDLIARIQRIPGVSSVAETLITPLGHVGWDDNVDIPDGPHRQNVLFDRVSPGYFQTMEMPLLAGRDFSRTDMPTSPRVAIVSKAFARKFFGAANPLGRIFHDSGKPDQTYQVIAIVSDSKYYTLRERPAPIVFVSFTQANGPEEQSTLVIRSNEASSALISSIKSAMSEMNSGIVLNFTVLKTQIRDGLLRERLMATLSGFFGGLATLLAMIGLYGVISYLVVRRRSEIGLRMALGANRTDILVMVLREAAILLGIGLAIGTGLALAAGNAAASMLYGLKPRDPLTLTAAITAMAVVGVAASLLPAKRAATVDPMTALREE